MNDFCQARIEKLQSRLCKETLPELIITDPTNVSYLTGFTGDSSYLLAMPNRMLMLSDTRFTVQLQEECPGLESRIRGASQTTLELALECIQSMKLPSLGIEAASMTRAFCDQLEKGLGMTSLVSTTGWIEELRSIKDSDELQKIRRSIAVSERTFEVIRAQLRGDMTEREIAFDLEHQMRKFGADRCSFSPIVGVGARAALPHARLTYQKISQADFVLIDWGAMVDGYASDLTRTLVTGRPSARMEEIYRIVLKAQQAAIDLIRPGAVLKEIDRAARKTIDDSGYGEFFGHGLGHGFGMQVHEVPFMKPTSEGTLRPGMVITVEPGIYLPGEAGVRIEDDVLVTADGYECLSQLPRDFDSQFVQLL